MRNQIGNKERCPDCTEVKWLKLRSSLGHQPSAFPKHSEAASCQNRTEKTKLWAFKTRLLKWYPEQLDQCFYLGWVCPRGTFGNVWRCCFLSVNNWREGAAGTWWVEAGDAVKHPAVPSSSLPPARNNSVPKSTVPRCRNPELDPATYSESPGCLQTNGVRISRGAGQTTVFLKNSPGESLKITGSTPTNWKMNQTTNGKL